MKLSCGPPATLMPISVLLAVFFFGCIPATKVPMDMVRYSSGENAGTSLLIVYLPGNGDRITVFEREGLLAGLRAHGVNADVIAVNAHLGYYVEGTIFTRIREDVIAPARSKGYGRIWLVGNSLGGYGSLSYLRLHPEDITGVVLLGPFLGDRSIISGIKDAGGLFQWEPGAFEQASWEGSEKTLWQQLRDCLREQKQRPGSEDRQGCFSHTYLGYGTRDRFTYGQEYLATLLPRDHVAAIDGGHDWSTWKTLWDRFLDQKIFGQ